MERPTTHVTGAILFFGAVSFDAEEEEEEEETLFVNGIVTVGAV